MPWAPADQMLNGLAKMIGKCCASLRSHSESSEAAKKSISQHKYQGPFHFQPNRLLYSDTSCQSGRRLEQRISIPTRKMDFPEHNCPCSCHIILLYLITELPMNFSWDRRIKHFIKLVQCPISKCVFRQTLFSEKKERDIWNHLISGCRVDFQVHNIYAVSGWKK